MAVSAAGSLKLEIAFGSDPDSASPVWTDCSAWLRDGVTITRGRTDEQQSVSPGRCTLSLDNSDGRFTPARAGSPYYPNVTPRRRMRLSLPGPVYVFDGHIDGWPVSWPTGGQAFSVAALTATDLLQSMGAGRTLGSVIHETVMATSPRGYWHLDERDGASSATSALPGGGPLVPQQVGSGGEIKWGSGTGPATDSSSAAQFAPVDATNGLLLTGSIPGIPTIVQFGVEAVVATTTPGRTVATLSDSTGMTVMALSIAPGGQAVAQYTRYWGVGPSGPVGDSVSAISSMVVADGRTHVLAAVLNSASNVISIYVDGVSAGASVATPPVARSIMTQITVGGSPSSLYAGTLSHAVALMGWTTGDLTAHATAALTGFAGERTDQRVARVCTWAGFPAARQVLSTGLGTVGHVDASGSAPIDYLRRIEAAEQGLIYADTQGRLVMRPRSDSWTAQAPALTVAADDALSPDAQVVLDLQGVANDVTVSRGSGQSARAVDAASVAAYGTIRASLDAPVSTDDAAARIAEATLARSATPVPRWPSITLDGYTAQTSGIASSVRALDIGSRVTLTSLPSQAPTSSTDVTVLGYTASIGLGVWDVTCNVAPYGRFLALIADDTGSTRADGPGVATY